MADPTWPLDVNQDMEDGSYSEQPDRNVSAFQPDVGPTLDHRRTSIASSMMSYTTVLTNAETESLLAFYKDDLKDGVLRFVRKHPRTRAVGYFKFSAEPKIAGINRWRSRVSIALQQLP